MKFLTILFQIVCITGLQAQLKETDSLLTVLSADVPDSVFRKNSTLFWGKLSNYDPSDYKAGLIRALTKEELSASQNKKFKISGRLNLILASLYEQQLMQDSALYYYFNATKSFEKGGDLKNSATTYYTIARIYYYKNNMTEANRYVNHLLTYYEQKGDDAQENLMTAYMFKAILLQNINDSIKDAGRIYDKAIRIGEKIRSGLLGVLYNNYGEYLDMTAAPVADRLLYFDKAKKTDINGDGSVTAYASFCISKIYWKIKKYDDAIKELSPAVTYWVKTSRFNDLLNAYELSYMIYEAKGDYKNTAYYLKKHMKLNDSLNKLTNSQNMAELDKKFQVEKKDKELLKLKEKAAIEQLEKEKQENKSMMLMIGIGFSLLLGGVALFAYFNKQKANKLLDQEKQVVEQQKEILEIKNKEILDSINYAKRIQNAILPSDHFFKEVFKESFIFYKPKDIVAGDFYWLYQKNNLTYLAVCDCTGHGVPGALVSVVCNNSLERAVNEFNLSKPSDILDKTRELVKVAFKGSDENVNDGMDMSLVCFPANIKTSTVQIQFAGANNPVYYIENNELKELEPDKQPIGNYAYEKPFTNHTASINADTCLYFYSDGYPDQFGGPKGKKFKYKQLNEMLLANSKQALTQQHQIMQTTFENWRGNLEQVDDVCVIGIRI